ncbi:MAG TPA: DUF192 domain-containing protein [Eubacteriaceae bacterium]|nr:DUF192 domain-containing protein [Eubacteriaceae bacterium]
MVLKNEKGVNILEELICADTFAKRFFGWMGKRKPAKKTGLLLEPCKSIHSFWMRFSLDVIFLDENNSVVEIISPLKPWKISPIVKDARKVIEAPQGTLIGQLTVGQRVQMLEK